MEMIVTNNPRVNDEFSQKKAVEFIDGDITAVFTRVRDRIHKGYKLLTHPLSGSVKPNETPFKTVLICTCPELDLPSLELIENALDACRKFPVKYPNMAKDMLDDFSLIDFTLFSSAINPF